MNVSSYLAKHKVAHQLIDPVWAILHAEAEIPPAQLAELSQKVHRLESGEPLAYVLNTRNFYGRDFFINQNVLIPRPETEVIIDFAKKLQPASVLDVGTGSGCIAITIKAELPKTKVDAVDISKTALRVAKQNAKKILPHQVSNPINFYQSDLIKNIDQSYDLIVANLPYVDRDWDWLDQKSLNYEPALALYAKDGGLALIKELILQIAARRACKNLILEADPCQHREIIEFAKKQNLALQERAGFILVFAT